MSIWHRLKAALSPTATGVSAPAAGDPSALRWEDLQRVVVMTTDDGPWAEDAFFILEGPQGSCVVPNAEAGLILPWLQRLPGFDNEALIRAMASTEDAVFRLWPPEGDTAPPT